MSRLLIVVDMQKDFIDGALGTSEAVAIVPNVVKKIEAHEGVVIYTRDTHTEDYLNTQEGQKLPVVHCVKETDGWRINEEVAKAGVTKDVIVIDKPSFGSVELGDVVKRLHAEGKADEIELIGLCTDICVISNAMIVKANLPEVPMYVDGSCCAGVTPASHDNALAAMRMCQITC